MPGLHMNRYLLQSRRRLSSFVCAWSSDVCSSDLDRSPRIGVTRSAAVRPCAGTRDPDSRGAIGRGTCTCRAKLGRHGEIGRASCRERENIPVDDVCKEKENINVRQTDERVNSKKL